MASRPHDPRFPATMATTVLIFVIALAVLVVIDKLSRLLNFGAAALIFLGLVSIIYGVVTRNKIAGKNTATLGLGAIAIGALTLLVTALSGLLWKVMFFVGLVIMAAVVIRSVSKRSSQAGKRATI